MHGLVCFFEWCTCALTGLCLILLIMQTVSPSKRGYTHFFFLAHAIKLLHVFILFIVYRPTSPYGKNYGVVNSKNVGSKSFAFYFNIYNVTF